MKAVVGLFDHFEDAEAAVRELTANGFSREDISLVAHDRRDERGETIERDGVAADSAAAGATGGAVLGGAAGFVLALTGLAIPGIGPILAAGPVVAALTGAAVGAGLGGMVGALTDLGVPEEEARFYAESVRAGSSLVTVHVHDHGDWAAADILRRHGAVKLHKELTDELTPAREPAVASSATLERPAAPSRIPEAYEPEEWDAECARHYRENLAGTGQTYDDFRPAYEYGFHAASDPRFATDSWEQTEANVRQDWSTRGQGAWDEVKDAVRCGWNCGHARAAGSAPRVDGFSASRDTRSPLAESEDTLTGDQFDESAGRRV